jgi:hypothetical protein
VARLPQRSLLPRELRVAVDHHANELREAHLRYLAELFSRLGCVAAKVIDLRRPEVAQGDLHVLLPVEPEMGERRLQKLTHRVGLPRRHDVVHGSLGLEHPPHRPPRRSPRRSPSRLWHRGCQVELLL